MTKAGFSVASSRFDTNQAAQHALRVWCQSANYKRRPGMSGEATKVRDWAREILYSETVEGLSFADLAAITALAEDDLDDDDTDSSASRDAVE